MSALLKKVFISLLLIYAVSGFLVLPFILKPKIVEIVSQETNANIEVGGIYINPFLFKAKLSDIVLKDSTDKELVSFSELFLDVEFYSLLRGAVHVNELSLVAPKVSLVYNADKTFNILNILKPKEVSKENNDSTTLPRIIVDEVSLKEGRVDFKDLSLKTPFDFSFTNIGFELKDLDTNEKVERDTRARFYTTLGDGGFVDFKSKIESLSSFRAKGTLDFEASKLYTEWKYVQDILNLEVADGKISFHGEYAFALEDLNATKIENLALSIEKLRVKPKAKNGDVLNIENLSVKNVTLLPFQQSVEIEKVSLDGLKVLLKRDSKGEIDWSEYIKVVQDENRTSSVAKEDQNTTTVQKPWSLLLKELALKRIALGFEDSTVSPSVNTEVNELNFYAKEITLLGEKPIPYHMDMRLNSKAKCNSKGVLKHKSLEAKTFLECQGLDIVHYNPYIVTNAKKALKRYDIDLRSAALSFNADADINGSQGDIKLLISNANVALNNLKIANARDKKEFFAFSNFLLNGITVDTMQKSVNLEKVTFNNFQVNLIKNQDSSLNIENLVVPKASKKVAAKKDEKAYSVKLKHFAVNSSSVAFKDNSLAKHPVNKIGSIYLNAYDIDLKKYSWLKYDVAMKINSKGSISSRGKLRHTPLAQSGRFDIKNISLVPLTPYLQESAHVSVEDGKLSLKGKTNYAKTSKDADLRVEGSVALKSFFLNDSLHKTLLFSLGELDVKSYTFELNPNRLYVDEVDVNSFYVDAVIDENKTLNFSELIKQREDIVETKQLKETEAQKDANVTFPYRIARINVALGSAKFADYSIPIKFATNIHDLGGSIYAVSNTPGDTTYVDITGEVDKYASTRLKGSIDSSNPKAYTDLDFNFKNLDLNSFSGYSASFAGHEIDEGKLYLDLGYDISNAQLLGSNSVTIQQIKLGREIEDENVTVLPLGFVIGLLEDTDGIIDIDMPVEGNLDEPDFKYGKVVVKAIGNLIAKAVTSPFKFLSSAMGIEGEALEFIAFEAGASDILPPQREKLDTIATLMRKKPKISLGIAGEYELVKDRKALQLTKLINLVVEKSGIKNIQDHKNVMNIDMLEDIYEDMRDDEILDQTQERLHALYDNDAEYERAYTNELITLCQSIQEVSDEELKTLAEQRANNIISYLVQEKMLESERIIGKPVAIAEKSDEEFVKLNMEIEVQ